MRKPQRTCHERGCYESLEGRSKQVRYCKIHKYLRVQKRRQYYELGTPGTRTEKCLDCGDDTAVQENYKNAPVRCLQCAANRHYEADVASSAALRARTKSTGDISGHFPKKKVPVMSLTDLNNSYHFEREVCKILRGEVMLVGVRTGQK